MTRYMLVPMLLMLLISGIAFASPLTLGNSIAYSTFQPLSPGANCIISNNYTFSCSGGGGGGGATYTAGAGITINGANAISVNVLGPANTIPYSVGGAFSYTPVFNFTKTLNSNSINVPDLLVGIGIPNPAQTGIDGLQINGYVGSGSTAYTQIYTTNNFFFHGNQGLIFDSNGKISGFGGTGLGTYFESSYPIEFETASFPLLLMNGTSQTIYLGDYQAQDDGTSILINSSAGNVSINNVSDPGGLMINGLSGISGSFETLCATAVTGTITYHDGIVTGDTCPP